MNPMKRLGVVATLVILGGLWTPSTTLAGKPVRIGYWLYATTVEPDASGLVGFNRQNVMVECVNLSPRQHYVVRFFAPDRSTVEYSVSADRNGNLTAKFRPPLVVDVTTVLNDDGALVLYGYWPPPLSW